MKVIRPKISKKLGLRSRLHSRCYKDTFQYLTVQDYCRESTKSWFATLYSIYLRFVQNADRFSTANFLAARLGCFIHYLYDEVKFGCALHISGLFLRKPKALNGSLKLKTTFKHCKTLDFSKLLMQPEVKIIAVFTADKFNEYVVAPKINFLFKCIVKDWVGIGIAQL